MRRSVWLSFCHGWRERTHAAGGDSIVAVVVSPLVRFVAVYYVMSYISCDPARGESIDGDPILLFRSQRSREVRGWHWNAVQTRAIMDTVRRPDRIQD
jgi:hypothetical protein